MRRTTRGRWPFGARRGAPAGALAATTVLTALALLVQPLVVPHPVAAAAGDPPVVAALHENLGRPDGGDTVVIEGSGFTGATGVRFGIANPAGSFTVDSDTQITAVTPPAPVPPDPLTLVNVFVDTPAGTSVEAPSSWYRYVPTPRIVAVTPTTSSTAGGQFVELTVEGFDPEIDNVRRVTIDGQPTWNYSYVSGSDPQVVRVYTPPHPVGTVPVVIETGGGPSNAVSIGYIDVPLPRVLAMAPVRGPVTGGTAVVLTGSGFTGATGVLLGDTWPAPSFTVDSDTQLTFVTPAVPEADWYDLQVLTPAGRSWDDQRFEFIGPPVAYWILPGSGVPAGGTFVEIEGRGLSRATGVRFGGVPATNWGAANDSMLRATTPPHEPGLVEVIVESDLGPSAPILFDYTGTGPPSVHAVAPRHGPQAGGNPVVITGTGFTEATQVRFGNAFYGSAASFSIDSATQITAVAPPLPQNVIVDVTVTNPYGTSATHPGDWYTYDPVPYVADVQPRGGPTTGGQPVVVHGSTFGAVTEVRFGETPATSFTVRPGGAGLDAVAPPHAAGPVPVVVTDANGSSLETAGPGNTYTYVLPGVPIVRGLDVQTAYTSGGGEVTITADDAAMTTGVRFGDVAAPSFRIVDAEHVAAVIPPHSAGITSIVLESVAGEGPNGSENNFWFIPLPEPQVGSLTPNVGPLAGGNTVTITGSGFGEVLAVRFGDVPAASFVVDSGWAITAVAPPSTATDDTVVQVSVTTARGTSEASWGSSYIYQAVRPLEIWFIDEPRGPIEGGPWVTIWGRGFTHTTGITFGDVPVTAWSVVGDQQLRVEVPAVDVAYLYNVTVTTAEGATEPGPSSWFLYLDDPQLRGMDRYSGPTAGGEQVTIQGDHLLAVYAVRFGDSYADFDVVDNHTIVVTVPACGEGTFGVELVSPWGTSARTLTSLYTYRAPGKPVVSGVAANRGPLAGGATVVISGSGFLGASGVRFGNVASASFTVDSDVQVTAVVPPRASPALVNVFVDSGTGSNPNGPASWYLYQSP